MIQELMPRMNTLDISIKIRKFQGDAEGFCMMADNNRQFEIEVSRELSLKDFVTALCHEMVHVKQFARNEWMIRSSGNYWDSPWEKEAYRMESTLAQSVWDANIL